METLIKHLTIAAVAAGLALSAHASPVLTLASGATTITDTTFTNGQALWSGSIGSWTGTIEVADTYPDVGSAISPVLDISVTGGYNGVAPNTLTITLSNDFGPTAAGGATGTLSSSSASDITLTQNGSGDGLSLTNGPLAGSFENVAFGGIDGGSSFVLSDQLVITANGSGTISADASLTVPDGGATALLMALGLAGIGFGALFRRGKSTKT